MGRVCAAHELELEADTGPCSHCGLVSWLGEVVLECGLVGPPHFRTDVRSARPRAGCPGGIIPFPLTVDRPLLEGLAVRICTPSRKSLGRDNESVTSKKRCPVTVP